MKNTLEIILKYGLSIRQIPPTITSLYHYSKKSHKREGGEIVVSEFNKDNRFDYEYLKEANKNSESFIYDDKTKRVYRKCIRTTRTPKYAGYWMCKQVKSSGEIVRWSTKADNLAPTLEESVRMFLSSYEDIDYWTPIEDFKL